MSIYARILISSITCIVEISLDFWESCGNYGCSCLRSSDGSQAQSEEMACGHTSAKRRYLNAELNGKVQARTLADQFDVSRETIRRDLLELEGRGGLLRVHGGALSASDDAQPEPAFADRLELHTDVKYDIGRKACELISPSSTVFIDAGTTTLAFAKSLIGINGIRIITNSIEIGRLATSSGNCETLLLGGKPHQEVPATYGELTLSEIDRFLVLRDRRPRRLSHHTRRNQLRVARS